MDQYLLDHFFEFLAMALPRIGLVSGGVAAGVFLVELLDPVSPRRAARAGRGRLPGRRR